ncbi:MAG: PAS domain-containing protein [Nitrospiraceae bacterium]
MDTDQITVLVASKQAEEVKHAAINLRHSYPGCVVEGVYSLGELLEWVPKQSWHVIFLDRVLLGQDWLTVLSDIRRLRPHTLILLQADQSYLSMAIQAMQAGVDYCLFKDGSGILSRLPGVTNWRGQQPSETGPGNLSMERGDGVAENLPDLVYQLDPEGRFVYLNRATLALLGVSASELIGCHFSKVVRPEDQRLAACRFNERRTGARATRHLKLRLVGPNEARSDAGVRDVEVNAEGRYSHHREFLGTSGIVRDVSGRAVDQSRQEQKIEAVVGLTAGIVYDLNAVLSVVTEYHRSLLQGLGPEHRQGVDFGGKIEQAVHLSAELSRHLQAMSRPQVLSPDRSEIVKDLTQVVERGQDQSPRHETGSGTPTL